MSLVAVAPEENGSPLESIPLALNRFAELVRSEKKSASSFEPNALSNVIASPKMDEMSA
jgi:hypothetical protein